MIGGNTTVTSPDQDDGRGPSRVRAVHVVYTARAGATAMLPLTGAPVGIGREADPAVALVVPDKEISRLHARLEPVDAGWQIVDQGSRNGVWHDGARVERAVLRNGSVIRLGASLLVFSDVELPARPVLAGESPGLLGGSLRMRMVRGELELIAARPVPVVLLGETGVGKEKVAEELHRRSGRSGRFVPVNCAAIPAGVAESELFGHVAGAFTGAAARSEGLFVAAAGGTLFLDEIGELPAPLQAKLLRALATGEIRPIGGSETRRVEVRVVAATHRDLDAMVVAGDFRADLLARLGACRIELPPLRARREDVLGLASHFLGAAVRLTGNAAEALLLHDWPFNVRELENTCAVAAARISDGVLRTEDLPAALAARVAHRARVAAGTSPPPVEAMIDRNRTPTRDELVALLTEHRGNLATIAELYGKDRKQIYRWLDRHGLDADGFRSAD